MSMVGEVTTSDGMFLCNRKCIAQIYISFSIYNRNTETQGNFEKSK